MPRKPSIASVGPGNLGTALALSLAAANYPIRWIAVRSHSANRRRATALAKRVHAKLAILSSQTLDTDIVWLTVPDDAIAGVARDLADSQPWKGKIVFHSSGALSTDELLPLRRKGARVASVHPMMTFVRSAVPRMSGVWFALEGDATAMRSARTIIKDLGGNAIVINKENKVLYHAFGSFASPLVIALMTALEDVGMAAGIRPRDIKKTVAPLLLQTLRNYLQGDAASAFSGPLARGDAATIRKHLTELKRLPAARHLYRALAKAALQNLPVKNRRAIERSLRQS